MRRSKAVTGLAASVFLLVASPILAQSTGALPDPAKPAQPWPSASAPPPPAPSPSTPPPPPAPPSSAPPPTGAVPTQPPPPPGAYGYPPYPPPYPPPVYPSPGAYYPPGYYQPPPYGGTPYPYGYDQPKPKPKYPDDAAVQTSPYFDLVAGGIALDQRYDQFLAVGLQAGIYLASRVRLAARGLLLTEKSGDNADSYGLIDSGYSPDDSERASFIYGASLGVAPILR